MSSKENEDEQDDQGQNFVAGTQRIPRNEDRPVLVLSDFCLSGAEIPSPVSPVFYAHGTKTLIAQASSAFGLGSLAASCQAYYQLMAGLESPRKFRFATLARHVPPAHLLPSDTLHRLAIAGICGRRPLDG